MNPSHAEQILTATFGHETGADFQKAPQSSGKADSDAREPKTGQPHPRPLTD